MQIYCFQYQDHSIERQLAYLCGTALCPTQGTRLVSPHQPQRTWIVASYLISTATWVAKKGHRLYASSQTRSGKSWSLLFQFPRQNSALSLAFSKVNSSPLPKAPLLMQCCPFRATKGQARLRCSVYKERGLTTLYFATKKQEELCLIPTRHKTETIKQQGW